MLLLRLIYASLLNGTFAQSSVDSTNTTFTLLADCRNEIKFIPLSPEEKKLTADAMVNLFEIWVNRESKLLHYGAEYDIDPLPKIKAVAAKAANMTEQDLHYEIVDIFKSVRDFHTTYYIPGPIACFAAFQPIYLDVVDEDSVEFGGPEGKIVAGQFATSKDILELAPEVRKITLGDELLEYNGIPVKEYIESKKYVTGGANEYGSLKATLFSMGVIGGGFSQFPKENAAIYKFRSQDSLQEYSVSLPWVMRRKDDCYKDANAVYESVLNGTYTEPADEDDANTLVGDHLSEPTGSRIAHASKNGKRYNPREIMLNYQFQFVKENLITGADTSGIEFTNTNISTLKWAIFDKDGDNMGIISLADFMPELGQMDSLIQIFRNLLVEELKDTNSILIDIRANPGGYIFIADMIPQFFGTNVESPNNRALNNDINKIIFSNIPGEDAWVEAINKSRPDSVYTNYVKFNDDSKMNMMGMAYGKPIGIFTDANCYSSCDAFSAHLKDNFRVTVYGEDGTTGAGGANVVEWEGFLNEYAPEYFPVKIPYKKSLANSGPPNASVGWRDSLRVKDSNGIPIEDIGIKTDKIVRKRVSDLTQQTSTQYQRIAKDLTRQGYYNLRRFNKLIVEPQTESYGRVNRATFKITHKGLRDIVVYDESGQIVGSSSIPSKQIVENTQNEFNFAPKDAKIETYTVKGYNVFKQEVFSTNRVFKITSSADEAVVLKSGDTLRLADVDSKALILEPSSIKGKGLGWVKKDGKLIIGDNVKYNDLVSTEYIVSLKTTTPVKVSIQAQVQTEKDFDYFYVSYIDPTFELINLFNATGTVTVDQTFEIPVTGDIQINLRFVSDAAENDKGVEVTKLDIFYISDTDKGLDGPISN